MTPVKWAELPVCAVFEQHGPDRDWTTLSMGMSGDWKIAVEEGSNMVRIGSAIFGAR